MDQDAKIDHLEWLVENRSETQESALELYKVLIEYPDEVKNNVDLLDSSQSLVAIAFSLWRAVFLSDAQHLSSLVYDDAHKYLEKIIRDNTIGYTQDKESSNWTFIYYVNSARIRLSRLATLFKLVEKSRIDALEIRQSPKEVWEATQRAFESAIKNLEARLKAARIKAATTRSEPDSPEQPNG